jgi:hypothetical protein
MKNSRNCIMVKRNFKVIALVLFCKYSDFLRMLKGDLRIYLRVKGEKAKGERGIYRFTDLQIYGFTYLRIYRFAWRSAEGAILL